MDTISQLFNLQIIPGPIEAGDISDKLLWDFGGLTSHTNTNSLVLCEFGCVTAKWAKRCCKGSRRLNFVSL